MSENPDAGKRTEALPALPTGCVAERRADYQVPRHVTVPPALPRNATGKILKTSLREMARG